MRQDAEVIAGGRDGDEGPRHFPPASQFSPGQINLGELLAMADRSKGNRDALEEEIRVRFFHSHASRREAQSEQKQQQLRLAGNAITAMSNYGLLTLEPLGLTELGEEILSLPDGANQLDRLAQHILTDLPGIDLISAARRIIQRNEVVTKASLQAELESDGFVLPRATLHHTTMGQWLREAGLFVGGQRSWVVDETKFEALTGQRLSTLQEWAHLTNSQQAFLMTLKRICEDSGAMPIASKTVIDRAEDEHGRIFRADQLSRTIFKPLADAGWFTMSTPNQGRGGRSPVIAPTRKLIDADFALMTGQTPSTIPPDVRAKLGTPLDEIYADLDSSDTYVKGVALELLAIRLAIDLNLTSLRFRKRGVSTGGGELDLIAEAAHLHFSRWLFQCKNKALVHLEDLAREVGMATLLRAHVVVIATTGTFTKSVEELSNELSKVTPLQVILVGGDLLQRYRSDGRSVVTAYFRDRARGAMQLKRNQVDEPIGHISTEG
jgi:hypothetical protein